MDWINFNIKNSSYNKSFEALCNQLFELWCIRNYKEKLNGFMVVNGSGGDGGVESLASLNDSNYIALQAKWFKDGLGSKEINQIKSSIKTALKIRPNIIKYVVCIKDDLTSKKMVKGGQIASNTGENKWNQLIKDMKEVFPALEVILWTESSIRTELSYDEAKGIYKFWFKNSEISNEQLNFSFQKQEAGWLNERYIHTIHSKGLINKYLSVYLGTNQHRLDICKKLEHLSTLTTKLQDSLNNYMKIMKKDTICDEIQSDIKRLNNQTIEKRELLQIFIDKYSNGICNYNEVSNTFIDYLFSNIIDEIKGYNFGSTGRSVRWDLETALRNYYNFEFEKLRESIFSENRLIPLIFKGERGTGKTHGVADFVKELQYHELHSGILIQASSVERNANWNDILISTLGLSNNWGEDELFRALESLAIRKEFNNTDKNSNTLVRGKILICVDGLEEREPCSTWLERIRVSEVISEKYPRIKFCYTTRPYIFTNCSKRDKYIHNSVSISTDGDTPVELLFDDYIKEYNIKLNGNEHIKWSIKTPLALKLFCECYKNSTIVHRNDTVTTITKLLKKKIEYMENEFVQQTNNKYTKNNFFVSKVITVIAKCLSEDNGVAHDKLLALISDNQGLNILDKPDKDKIIEFLHKHGVVSKQVHEIDDILTPPTIVYTMGINSFIEYILAINILERCKTSDNLQDIAFPGTIKSKTGILQMISIICLEKYNLLLSDILWFKNNVSDFKLQSVVNFALINVDPDSTVPYVTYVQNKYAESPIMLKRCLNEITIPVSRVENHPLGTTLIDKYLLKFDTTYERDCEWSLAYEVLQDACYHLDENKLLEKRYMLSNNDIHNGLPIIYAWYLSSLDNSMRKLCRIELTKWGIERPSEFILLLNKFYLVNDQQIREDMLAIASGIIYSKKLGLNDIALFSKWVLENIFSEEKITETLDIAIRYYGRTIMEFAYNLNVISSDEREKCIPPYKYNNDLLPLNIKQKDNETVCSHMHFDYDLDRYVLCDPIIHDFFRENLRDKYSDIYELSDIFTLEEIEHILECNTDISEFVKEQLAIAKDALIKLNKYTFDLSLDLYLDDDDDLIEDIEIIEEKNINKKCVFEDLLNHHKKMFNLSSISEKEFILSAADYYLKDVGYKEKKYSRDRSYLQYNYKFKATHGQKSSIMNFDEKYVWSFKNTIYGYLSDRLPYYNDVLNPFLKDYRLIEDFIDTNQEINEEFWNIMNNKGVMRFEELSPTIVSDNEDKDIIVKWRDNTPIPSFEKWINIKIDDELLLDQKSLVLNHIIYLYDKSKLGETLMWINAIAINKEYKECFLKDVLSKKEHILSFLHRTDNLKAVTDTACYITPKELCAYTWLEQQEEYFPNAFIKDGNLEFYNIYKTYEECTFRTSSDGETSSGLPSKFIRDLLNINNYEANKFFNKNNRLVCQYYSSGGSGEDYNSILYVDKKILLEKLKKAGIELMWVVQLRRDGTINAYEHFGPSAYTDHDDYYICYYDDDNKFIAVKFDTKNFHN